MKLPRLVLVKDDLWQVCFKKVIPNEEASTLGVCDGNEQMIYIRMGQSDRDRFKTFLHEIAHALEFSWGIEIPHPLIYALEEPLYRLLFDNFI